MSSKNGLQYFEQLFTITIKQKIIFLIFYNFIYKNVYIYLIYKFIFYVGNIICTKYNY